MNLRKKGFMSMEMFEHIVGQLGDVTVHPIRLHVDGEPMLHPNFPQMVNALSDKELPVIVATNGSLLDLDYLDLKMDMLISISINEAEFTTRSKNLSFQNYIDKITAYLAGWIDSDAEQTLLVQIKYRADHFETRIQEIDVFIKGLDERLQLSQKLEKGFVPCKYEGIDHELDKDYCYTKKNGRSIYFCIRPINQGPNYMARQESDPVVKKGFCSCPWQEMAILWDGRVSFCCMDLTAGTAFTKPEAIWEKSLLDIWRDSKIADIRRDFAAHDVRLKTCQRCLAKIPENAFYAYDHPFKSNVPEKSSHLLPVDSLGRCR